MPPLCADNNNLLACHIPMASSARSEASLVAIAQQLLQQQQHRQFQHAQNHHHFHPQQQQYQQQQHHQPPPPYQQQVSPIDYLATSWQAKTEEFANSFYSDAMFDIIPFAQPSVMDLSASAHLMPCLDSQIQDTEFLMREYSMANPNEALNMQTPELSQTLTSIDEVGELVQGLLPTTTTGQPNCLGFSDMPPEWMDCLVNDADEAIVSCFETKPCESTQSSEPAGASCGYPCTPLEDALPDVYMQACSPTWTQETGNEVLSCALSASSHDVMNICVKRERVQEVAYGGGGGFHAVEREAGMRKASSSTSLGEAAVGGLQHQVPAHGVQLMKLLLECAKAVDNDHERARIVLPKLQAQSTRYGDPIQRLAAYFTEALYKRLARAQGIPEPTYPVGECSPLDLTLAYKAMNAACPYFTFAQLTANQAILEAIDGADRVHIVDFGISQGVQWAAMLQAIAVRSEGHKAPDRIRITGVASPELGEKRGESLAATGRRLADFARALKLNVEFRPAAVALDDDTLAAEMLGVEDGEVVVVNFMLELCNLLDGAGNVAISRTLRVAAQLSPKIATVAEMDAHLNNGPFQKRFVSALHFYSAMFDSLEAGMGRDSPHRLRMERWLLGERIHSMVGGGDDGLRRRLQAHSEWRAALEATHFRPCPLSHYAVSQARILLWSFCESFTLNEQQGSLSLGWQNKPLLTVSAWTIEAS